MSRRRGIWIVALLAAVLGAGAVVVHAGSAAPTLPASALDVTYSCRVQSQHFVSLYAGVTLTTNGKTQPGGVFLNTGVHVIKSGTTTTSVNQVGVEAVKHGVKIDKSACRKVKQQIPLKPKGLPSPPTTVTPSHAGYDSEQCNTTARVLFRVKVKMTGQKPSHALLAIRDVGGKNKPVAFYNWSPQKVAVYTSFACGTP
ncbi:MAG TPA: hypothetical protein VKB43_06925 [Gaiellaceae bacterium]|nr:hypothetical protein [Gaiellaceae bacterium]